MSMLFRMYKYRLYPTKHHLKILEEHLEICRTTYNYLLNHCKEQYKEKGKIPTQFDLNNHLTALKKTRSELFKVHSQVLQNLSKRITGAYNNFYARRKAGLKAGFPRFKKLGRYRSISYPQSGYKIRGNYLELSKIGRIRMKLHRPIESKIKTLNIKRAPSGKWFACFSCIIEAKTRDKAYEDAGMDVGIDRFAVLSNGTFIENPRYLRQSERRLSRLQRSMSRKKKGSHNWVKAKVKLARLHEKISNSRDDCLHKASRRIVDEYYVVYVEDLNIGNMVKNRHLAKSISDASWGRFIRMIAYKEEESGGQLVFVNPRNTSQLCSQCGKMVEKSLSERMHKCPHCGLVMDRDLNASRNILKIGRGPPESKPAESMTSTLPLGIEQVDSVNQETFLKVGK